MSEKRVNVVKVRLSDRQLCDLSNMADMNDRSPSDMAYLILTKYIYGHHAPDLCGTQGAHEAEQARHLSRRMTDV